jgi:lipopolysaccharide export system protein LptA
MYITRRPIHKHNEKKPYISQARGKMFLAQFIYRICLLGSCAVLFLVSSPSLHAEQKSPLMGAVIASDHWTVERKGGKKIEIFTGNVRYRRKNRSLYSDWVMQDHQSQILTARGNVRAQDTFDSGEILFAQGHKAEHNIRTEKGFLIGASETDFVHLKRTVPGSNPENGTARRMEWDGPSGVLWLIGDVHLQGSQGEAWAQKAHYTRSERKIVLEQARPVLKAQEPTWSGAVQADRITGLDNPKRVLAEGKARGWVYFPNRNAYLKKTP